MVNTTDISTIYRHAEVYNGWFVLIYYVDNEISFLKITYTDNTKRDLISSLCGIYRIDSFRINEPVDEGTVDFLLWKFKRYGFIEPPQSIMQDNSGLLVHMKTTHFSSRDEIVHVVQNLSECHYKKWLDTDALSVQECSHLKWNRRSKVFK